MSTVMDRINARLEPMIHTLMTPAAQAQAAEIVRSELASAIASREIDLDLSRHRIKAGPANGDPNRLDVTVQRMDKYGLFASDFQGRLVSIEKDQLRRVWGAEIDANDVLQLSLVHVLSHIRAEDVEARSVTLVDPAWL